MNTPVSPPLAKLLKEKGLDDYTQIWYQHGEGISGCVEGKRDYYNRKGDVYTSAPTISDVIMWLYEKHEIWIQVKPGGKLETWDFIVQKKDNTFAVSYFEIKQHKPFFNSPTEAYEAAIEYTLKNLI